MALTQGSIPHAAVCIYPCSAPAALCAIIAGTLVFLAYDFNDAAATQIVFQPSARSQAAVGCVSGDGAPAYGAGWIYNVSDLLGIEVELKGGSLIRLGTNQPNYLLQAIDPAKANAE